MKVYDVTIYRRDAPQLKLSGAPSFLEANKYVHDFVEGCWDDDKLGPLSKSRGQNALVFFNKMRKDCDYRIRERTVPDSVEESPTNLDEIELSPLEVEIITRALYYGAQFSATIAKSADLEIGEVSDILDRVTTQLKA